METTRLSCSASVQVGLRLQLAWRDEPYRLIFNHAMIHDREHVTAFKLLFLKPAQIDFVGLQINSMLLV